MGTAGVVEMAGKAGSGGGPACFWLNRPSFPTTPQRTIVMTGAARTGTSFVSSVFARLGLPMGRNGRDLVSGHFEHVSLREALVAGEHSRLKEIIAEFDARFDVWGWKAPAIRKDFETVAKLIRNPCFVFVSKEPLSVALRKIELGRKANLFRLFNRITQDYIELVEYAQASPHPCMLVSYDRALQRIDECIAAFAAYAGITTYDSTAVQQAVTADGARYVQNLASADDKSGQGGHSSDPARALRKMAKSRKS